MKENHKTKFFLKHKWLFIVVSVWTLLSALLLNIFAAEKESTFQNFLLEVSSEGEIEITVNPDGWTVKAYGTTENGCSSTDSTVQVSFTITNTAAKSDGSVRSVEFKITTTNMADNSTNESVTLSAESNSKTYKATSGAGSANCETITIVITDIKLEAVGATVSTTFDTYIGGTYTVDGETIIGKTSKSASDDTVYMLTATPSAGYSLFGWMSLNGVLDSSGSATISYTAENENTVWPLFIKTDSAVYYIKDASPHLYYGYFDEAIVAAGSSETIVLCKSGTMYASDGDNSFNLSGQTFLIPYSASDTSIATSTSTDDSGSQKSTLINANAAFTSADAESVSGVSVSEVLEPNKNVYLTLTIPAGTTLTVKSGGKFVVGGTIVSGTSSTNGIAGATAGAHSNVQLDGTLNIEGGILSCCGYILGNGKITVSDNGTAYQPFIMVDYRGGRYTANCYQSEMFPSIRYSMQNIQAPLEIEYGSKMYGYITIFTKKTNLYITTVNAQFNVNCVAIIGPESSSGDEEILLVMSEGSSLNSSYDQKTCLNVSSSYNSQGFYSKIGKTTLEISGGATLGSLKISVTVGGVMNIESESSSVDFPIPYNYDIILNDGTYTVPHNLMLLPGANMTVSSDATLVVSNATFSVFDGVRDYSSTSSVVSVGTWYGYHYPSTEDLKNNGFDGTANLIVNGTMTVENGANFGGYVQTDGTGIVQMNGDPSATVSVGTLDYHSVNSGNNRHAGKTERVLGAWIYGSDGTRVTMSTGTTYYGFNATEYTAGTYSYDVYTNVDDTSAKTPITETLNATIKGTWYTHSYKYQLKDGSELVTYYSIGEGDFSETDETGAYTWSQTAYAAPLTTYTAQGLNVTNALIEYRIENYLWLDIQCTLGGSVSDAFAVIEDDTYLTANGDYVITNGNTITIARKVLATEIPEEMSFVLSYNGVTYTVTSSLSEYSKNQDTDTQALIQAMLVYGEAAEDYFEKNANETTATVTVPNVSADDMKMIANNTSDKSYSISNYGVKIGLDNCITFIYGMDLKITDWDNVLQVGLLRCESDKLEDGTYLTTENCDVAYLLYYTGNIDQTDGDGNKLFVSNDTTNGLRTVAYDIPYSEYNSVYTYRAYILYQDGENTYAVYGDQFNYSLATYIANRVEKSNDNAEKTFLYATWNYKVAVGTSIDAKSEETV